MITIEPVDLLAEALWAKTADQAAEALACDESLLGAAVFADCMTPALQGHWSAVELVVGAWHFGVQQALMGFSTRVPDVVWVGSALQVKTLGGEATPRVLVILDAMVADVPSSALLNRFGLGRGMSLNLLQCVRSALPHGPGAFDVPAGFPDLPEGADVERFRRMCEVAVRKMRPPLSYVASQFGLTRQELASLFGVSRQAVDEWESRDRVPNRHAQKLADLVAVAELLDRKLKPGRLQLLVRQPSPAFDGATFLDMVRNNRTSDIRRQTEEALDWAATA